MQASSSINESKQTPVNEGETTPRRFLNKTTRRSSLNHQNQEETATTGNTKKYQQQIGNNRENITQIIKVEMVLSNIKDRSRANQA